MLLLPEKDVSQLLRRLTSTQCQELLNDLTGALGAFSGEKNKSGQTLIHQPIRSHIVTKAGNASLFMPVSDTSTTGIKVVTISGDGGELNGTISVFSPEGRLIGLLGAVEATAFRTALATMTLFTRCTSLRRKRVVIFGSGNQAEWHARLALILVPEEIETITFINRGRERLDRLTRSLLPQLQQHYPNICISILPKDGTEGFDGKLRSELSASDVIFCCTPSTEPLFPHSYLQSTDSGVFKPRFISMIGSYKPHMQEIDSTTLLSGGGKIYVDSKEACLEESGELIKANIRAEQLVEIGELFVPQQKLEEVKVSRGCNVVFKCVGMGIMDLVMGRKLLEIASESGFGAQIDGF